MMISSDASYAASIKADWEWLKIEKINSVMANRTPAPKDISRISLSFFHSTYFHKPTFFANLGRNKSDTVTVAIIQKYRRKSRAATKIWTL